MNVCDLLIGHRFMLELCDAIDTAAGLQFQRSLKTME